MIKRLKEVIPICVKQNKHALSGKHELFLQLLDIFSSVRKLYLAFAVNVMFNITAGAGMGFPRSTDTRCLV